MQKHTIILSTPFPDGEHYEVSVFSGFSDMGPLYVDGLIKTIMLSGDNKLYIKTESDGVFCFTNLFTEASKLVIQCSKSEDLALAIYLQAISKMGLNNDGHIFLFMALNPSDSESILQINSSGLSISILSVISDWSDYFMSELSDKTLNSMIYLEV